MKLQKHILFVVLIPALIAVGVVSYNRFLIHHDYLVSYEGSCDPITEECFVGCENQECAQPYYYAIVEKDAAYLYERCGPDITGCEFASTCSLNEDSCSILYCDPMTEACDDVEVVIETEATEMATSSTESLSDETITEE
jgi:hypothetical protein